MTDIAVNILGEEGPPLLCFIILYYEYINNNNYWILQYWLSKTDQSQRANFLQSDHNKKKCI